MKTSEAIRNVMNAKNMGVNALAKELDSPPRRISERLSQENISIVKLNEMLRVLGYQVAILPSDFSLPEGGYQIE